MKRLLVPILIMLCLLVMQACVTRSEQPLDRVGDTYEIFLKRVTETSGDRSSSKSRSQYTLTETVIAHRENGTELEFDLPEDTSMEDRARNWQFPVRVFKQEGRSFELLNRQQIESRVQIWLKKWEIDPDQCGRWGFTWTAYKIECDPDSAIDLLAPFDLRVHGLYKGALYSEPFALEPTRLRAEINDLGRQTYIAEMKIDPEVVRRDRSEQALVVAELTGEAAETFESALKAQADDQISGTITTTFETDKVGRVIGRVRLIAIETTFAEDAAIEREIVTEITTRTPP